MKNVYSSTLLTAILVVCSATMSIAGSGAFKNGDQKIKLHCNDLGCFEARYNPWEEEWEPGFIKIGPGGKTNYDAHVEKLKELGFTKCIFCGGPKYPD
ncbi:hypothetical protein ASD8599_03597 [Ascidiaceihabitans donghaensis]|uniref:Uncharacterized protein n=1 Tax=Ascidiaceihabitans donghaensis TaxID=1510460 RepID=A0A2R8BIA5_9RHOB|nr:hypothetical protein [Ascidiaceihabitans donghaensis]SPH22850.1 hypothetical protein ASD8599_03597 [Ascidiaceihabitans donghaensis]